MWIYFDLDGTLTQKQCSNTRLRVPIREDMVERARALAASDRHQVVLWSKSGRYARRFAEKYEIDCWAACGKPGLIVDNQVGKFGRQLRNIVTPEQFLDMDL